MRRLKSLAGGVAAILALAWASAALATGSVHIEWLRNGHVYSAQTISATSSSVQSTAAPDFGGVTGQARVTVTAGAVVLVEGPNVTATQTNGLRMVVGQDPVTISGVATGDVIAIIEATDGPPSGGGGGGAVTGASGAFVDGWNATLGAEADAACGTDNGTCTGMALAKRLNQRLTTLNTTLGTPAQDSSLSTLNTSIGTTNTDIGAPGASACTTDTASCSQNQQLQRIAQRLTTINTTLNAPAQETGGHLASIDTNTSAPTPAGTNIIGKFGIDQTTVGTTNGVSVAQIGTTTVSTGTGATGAGSQRTTVAQDANTVAGSIVGVIETCHTGTVAAATATCTLATNTGQTTRLMGFQITGGGATSASVVACTVTGLISGTWTIEVPVPAGATLGITPVQPLIPIPIPASTTNTSIVISCPTFGSGNTAASINAWGALL